MPNFLWQPERIWNAKGSESKSAEKKERKLALKKLGTGNRKKKNDNSLKSTFWLMRMHQIEIFYNFVPNLGKIYLSDYCYH